MWTSELATKTMIAESRMGSHNAVISVMAAQHRTVGAGGQPLCATPSVKPLDLADVVRRHLGQQAAVGSVNLGHWRTASLVETDVRLVNVSILRASGKINNADADAGKRPRCEVVAEPVAVADSPPPAELVQARTQILCGGIRAYE